MRPSVTELATKVIFITRRAHGAELAPKNVSERAPPGDPPSMARRSVAAGRIWIGDDLPSDDPALLPAVQTNLLCV